MHSELTVIHVKGFELWRDGLYLVDPRKLAQAREDNPDFRFELKAGNLALTCPPERLPFLQQVCAWPMTVLKRGEDIVTGQRFLQLAAYPYQGREIAHWYRRDVLADARAIVKIAADGFPVTSENARVIVGYLQKCESAPIDSEFLSSRSGFHDMSTHLEEATQEAPTIETANIKPVETIDPAATDPADYLASLTANPEETINVPSDVLCNASLQPRFCRGCGGDRRVGGWLVGQEWVGTKEVAVIPSDPNEGGLLAGLASAGEWDRWRAKFTEVCRTGPIPRFLLFSQFAAPLLRHLPARSFVIHHWGTSSGGKTALALFGASVWGRPKGLAGKKAFAGTLNATSLSIPAQFEVIDDLPVILDELQASDFKNRSKDILQLIYTIVLGDPRMRLNSDGTRQKQRNTSWRTIVRFTGEQALLHEESGDLGGARNRLIQIEGETGLDSKSAGKLHDWMETEHHYGLAGPMFLQKLLQVVTHKEGCTDAPLGNLQTIRKMRKDIQENIDCGRMEPRNAHIAVVSTAQALAATWLFGADPDAAIEGAIDDGRAISDLVVGRDMSTSLTYIERVIDFLRQHRSANPKRWLDLTKQADRERLLAGDYDRVVGYVPRSSAIEAGEGLWLIPRMYRNLLRANQLEPTRFESDAVKAGFILPDKSQLTRKRLLLPNTPKARVIVIAKSAMEVD